MSKANRLFVVRNLNGSTFEKNMRANSAHVSVYETKHKAFTLIEVLVVLVVISLLAAIILPSLKTAREGARCAVCATHLRQLICALEFYAGDHQGWLFSAEPPKESGQSDPTNEKYWFMNDGLLRYVKVPIRRQADGTVIGPPAEVSLLTCPTDKNTRDTRPVSGQETVVCDYALSYAVNIAMGIGGRPRNENLDYRRLSEFNQPSLTLAWTDAWSTITSRGVVAAFSCPKDNFAFRHNKAANIVFLDSHVCKLRSKHIPFGMGKQYLPFWSTKKQASKGP